MAAQQGGLNRSGRKSGCVIFMLMLFFPAKNFAALPQRLVLLLDGVSYRDVKALQEGITNYDADGRQIVRHAFNQGYFPVSRNISTFPSVSDVAWTEILGDCPLPGYQRTYFSAAADSEIFQNGVTTTMEYEKQMDWQVQSGFRRAMGYVHVDHAFKYETDELVENFLKTNDTNFNYYAMIRSTDDAQHMSGNIFDMLCILDQKLQALCACYRKLEGHDLQILIISDHGNNHAGAGKRVDIKSFLEKSGYHVAESIRQTHDVVLPTAGIESWVEIHNSSHETLKLLSLLSHLEGVDILTARVPGTTNRFIVMNSKGEKAFIDWNPTTDSFRYTPKVGDPLNYSPVKDALLQNDELGADGFATADAWMAETLTNHYPLALERIVRAHTRVTLNPATILISLKNGYVNAGWLVKEASKLVTMGGTHGALDDINSDGIFLSNFMPTWDTSTSRLAKLFQGFKGLRDYRAEESGAEWFSRTIQTLTPIKRTPLDDDALCPLPSDEIFLRVWTPRFEHLKLEAPLDVAIEKISNYPAVQMRGNSERNDEQHLTLNYPLDFSDNDNYERLYAFPKLKLDSEDSYQISGWIDDHKKDVRLFTLNFRTDNDGKPIAY